MIDYAIHLGRGTGATVDLAPGITGPADDEFIHLDEEAFFVIEGFFDPASRINHYGPTVVSIANWSKAMACIAAEVEDRMRDTLLIAFKLDQINKWDWLARHPQILHDVQSRGMPALRRLLTMLDEFAKVGVRWSSTYPAVYIFGV
jgi:hypothetical protein